MNTLKSKQTDGYTLIELLLYISIATILLGLIVYFLFTIIQSRVKNQTIIEVEEQGMLIMNLIDETIQEAESVNSPGFGNESDQLNLEFSVPNQDPTVFSIDQHNIYMQKGTDPSIMLNSDNIKITNLRFTNTSRPNTSGLIRVQFDVSYNNQSDRPEFNYTETFYSSISIRQRR